MVLLASVLTAFGALRGARLPVRVRFPAVLRRASRAWAPPQHLTPAAARASRSASVSACGFGLMAIFATQAYDAGARRHDRARDALRAGRGRLLGDRAVRRSPPTRRSSAQSPRGRRGASCSARSRSALGYTVQSGLFFSALRHIDASLASLLLYTFPVLVCCGAIVLGRERFEPWKAAVLARRHGRHGARPARRRQRRAAGDRRAARRSAPRRATASTCSSPTASSGASTRGCSAR